MKATKWKVGYMMQGWLAEGLRVIRARQGLTLVQAAEKIGVDRHTLRDLELGRRGAYLPTVEKIAEGYGVPVEDLLEEPTLAGKAEASREAGPQSLTDIPQDEFLRALSDAVSDAALLDLFGRMDAERTHLELVFRGNEGNSKAHNTFARALQRRMVVLLALVERGIAPPDPEKTRLAEQLDSLIAFTQR